MSKISKWALNLVCSGAKGLLLGVCTDERREGNGPAGLEGLFSSRQWNKAKKQQRMSLKSVCNSETDVTVNLSTFAELLTVQMTQKAQQNRWIDPSKDWRQNEGLQGLKSKENSKKGVMGCLQKRALP